MGAVYSPDGKRILSWSSDKTLRLWDAATGAAIGEPLRHEDAVGAQFIRRTESASCRGLMTRRCGFGTRPRASDRRAAAGRGRSLARFIHRTGTHLVVVSRQHAEALGRGDRVGDRRTDAARECDSWRDLFTGRQRILSWSQDKTLRLWDVSWRGDNLFEIACNTTPMTNSKKEMERLSKRYGVTIEEPICQPGVKIPDPDWSRTEAAHAE